ncbi:helix-turn-helix domain-containing protein [Pectinatus frisingensis]|uniref:helix-turn-helix domain-containing protein n=1 Tax=Pectinatus frisingensis TaxID=865 RepID=UPI0018C5AAE4|nr:helix-turn-helix transcriptional regulator [Pectinatus frisingensis]
MRYSIRIRLKDLLEKNKIKQKQLAEMTGIRESTISDICRGSRTVMNFEHIAKIAEVLKITDIRDLIELTCE